MFRVLLRVVLATGLVGLFLTGGPVAAPASHDFTAPPILSARDQDLAPGEVLVRWRDDATADALAEVGASVLDHVIDDHVTLLRVPIGEERRAAARLTVRPEVVWAQPNYVRSAQMMANDPLFPQQWGLQRIQTPDAWDVTTGTASVVVAVVDTGVDLGHPELQGKIVDGRNFLEPDESPQDDGGHGTHVAGTIAATINNGMGIAGIAPGVSIMPIKVLKADGSGKDSTVAAGMRWAIDHGARIINMSFSGAEVSPALTEAVAYAQSKNVLLVVAAGNEGSSDPTFPAATDPVIAVGATDQADHRAYYSNFGDWIDIAGPGTNILSTYWDGTSTYRTDTGTSMAAPHVTGVIALLLSLHPEYSIPEVEAILRSTADPIGDSGLGAGRVNAARAVAAAAQLPPTPTPPPPTAVATPTPTPPPSPVPGRSRAFTYNTPSPASTVYLPALARSTDGWNSHISVMNTGNAPASTTIRLIEVNGSSTLSLNAVLPANASTTVELESIDFLSGSWEGSGVISSEGAIASVVTATRASWNSIAYDGRVGGTPVAYAPLVFKNRNGWSTTAYVQNLGADPTFVQLAYTSADGPGVWTDRVSIPAAASRRISLRDTTAIPDNFVGGLTATSQDAQPLALVILETNPIGNAAAYTAPLNSGTNLVAPVVFKNRRTNGTWNTGVQIQNLGADTAHVTVTYRGTDGPGDSYSDRGSIDPGGSRTFYQPSSPGLPDGFVGSATIAVDNAQLVSGLVNEVNYDRNVSSTYQVLASGQNTLYAPLLMRNVAGANTGLQVQNLGQQAAALTITYRSQTGTALLVQSDVIGPGSAKSYFQPAIGGLPDGFIGSATVVADNGQPIAAIVNAVAY
ncbi:MAG TPA: S8 family peptidase [Chloroflexota bacterium]|nr:S8 family peptidase [Chloroflexota bacterium]